MFTKTPAMISVEMACAIFIAGCRNRDKQTAVCIGASADHVTCGSNTVLTPSLAINSPLLLKHSYYWSDIVSTGYDLVMKKRFNQLSLDANEQWTKQVALIINDKFLDNVLHCIRKDFTHCCMFSKTSPMRSKAAKAEGFILDYLNGKIPTKSLKEDMLVYSNLQNKGDQHCFY